MRTLCVWKTGTILTLQVGDGVGAGVGAGVGGGAVMSISVHA